MNSSDYWRSVWCFNSCKQWAMIYFYYFVFIWHLHGYIYTYMHIYCICVFMCICNIQIWYASYAACWLLSASPLNPSRWQAPFPQSCLLVLFCGPQSQAGLSLCGFASLHWSMVTSSAETQLNTMSAAPSESVTSPWYLSLSSSFPRR